MLVGPLWIDNLFDSVFVSAMLNELKNNENYSSSTKHYHRLLRMMQTCDKELAYPYYFETDTIAAMAKRSSISLDIVVSTLSDNGFKVSKTIMNPKGFKTNASQKEIINFLYK
jgi:tRNA G26 N,N-dimethylase Trm1